MARKTAEQILEERRKKNSFDPYGGDPTAKQRNIKFVDDKAEDVYLRRSGDYEGSMTDQQSKDYARPYYDFTRTGQQNSAVQKTYDTLVKPNYGKMDLADPFRPKTPPPSKPTIPSYYAGPGYTAPQNRPKENATHNNIPKKDYSKATQQLQDTFKTTSPIQPTRPNVPQSTANQMRMSPMDRMNEFEYQTGAKRPSIDPTNPQSIKDNIGKYPYAPQNQGELYGLTDNNIPGALTKGLTGRERMFHTARNFGEQTKQKTKAFLTGVTAPITKPLARFFNDGMKDKNGKLPQDGSTYNRINNWYMDNQANLIQAGYSKKAIKDMMNEDLRAAQQEDNDNLLKSSMDKPRRYDLTGADRFANMAGEVTGSVGAALGTGSLVGAAAPMLNPIAQSALVGGITGATSSYGERNDIATVAKDMARQAMFYGAGKVGSDYVGKVAGELISKYGLETSAAALYATEAVKGLAFDAAGYGATLPTYPLMGDDMPTGKEVAVDMLVGALFDFIPNAFDVKNTLETNTIYKWQDNMGELVKGIKKDFETVSSMEKHNPNDVDTLNIMFDKLTSDMRYVRENINKKPIPGQDQTVEALNGMFDRAEVYMQKRKAQLMKQKMKQDTSRGIAPEHTENTQRPMQGTDNGTIREVRAVEQEPQIPPMSAEQMHEYHKQRNNEMVEEFQKRGNTNITPPQPRPDLISKNGQKVEQGPQTAYGKNGKKAFTKWGQNEYVMADLNNTSNPYTQDYKRFFEAWYEAGRLGLPEYQVRVETANHFPAFLETAFYQAGKNDMEKGSPKAGTNIPRPETQEAINPITTPLKPEGAPEVGPIDRDTPSVRGEETPPLGINTSLKDAPGRLRMVKTALKRMQDVGMGERKEAKEFEREIEALETLIEKGKQQEPTTPPNKTNTPVDIQKPLKGYELPEDYENPNYKGEYKAFGPKGEKLIGNDPNNTRPYQDGVMGKTFDPEAYGMDAKAAEKLYNAGLDDRNELNYRERLIINQYQNIKGQLKRLIGMGMGDKPIAEGFKKELQQFAPAYEKLDPRKFKFQSPEPTAPKVKPEDQEGYVESNKGPTIETVRKRIDHEVAGLIITEKPRMDEEEQGSFTRGLTELTKKTLKDKAHSQKSLNRKIQEYFRENTIRFTMLNEAYNKTGKNTPQEIYEIQKPFTAQFLSERRAIKQAAKEKDIQKTRYAINERIGVLELMNPMVYAIINPYDHSDPRWREATDWIKTEAKEDLIQEVLKKLGFSEKQIKQYGTDKPNEPTAPGGRTKVEDFESLKPGTIIYDKNLEAYTFKEAENLGNAYQLKVENKEGNTNYLYTNEPIYKDNLPNKVNVEQAQQEPPKPKEVLEVTQTEYDAAKADYEASGRPFPPEDIELKVIDQEQEVAATEAERKAWEKQQELEAKKTLNERHKEAYDYLKAYRNGKKAAVYYKSPELAGVDDLKAISNFIRFIDDKKAHKLDVFQMEMAKDFPEVKDLGLEEFGQFLVDSVKAYRSNDKDIQKTTQEANEWTRENVITLKREDIEAMSLKQLKEVYSAIGNINLLPKSISKKSLAGDILTAIDDIIRSNKLNQKLNVVTNSHQPKAGEKQFEEINPLAKDLKTYTAIYEKYKRDIRRTLWENEALQKQLSRTDKQSAAIAVVGHILEELPKYAKNFRFENAGPDELAMHALIYKELQTNETFLKSFIKPKEEEVRTLDLTNLTVDYVKSFTRQELETLSLAQLKEVYSVIGNVDLLRNAISKKDIIESIIETVQDMKRTDAMNAKLTGKPILNAKEDPMPFDFQHETPKNEPVRVLAEDIMRFIATGTELSPGKLYEMANKAFGGTQTEGKYEIKDAHDAMELAVNLYLRQNGKTFLKDDSKINYAKVNVEKLENLIRKLPSITKRSERTDAYQQFSTPPTVAYLAAYAANMTNQDVVLEPSAGIGGLAVFADLKGARVVVNELEPKRLETLKEMGYETYNFNAEQIDNLLPQDIKPTVVIMNPPFSSAPERMGDKKATANAKRHIEQALERLVPGGRLVVIVGEGMADDTPTFKGWFNTLRNDYNIRANLSLNKEAFRKYGTTFGTQLIVIDKTGAQTGKTLTGKYETLAEIPKVLEGIRNERRAVEPTTIKPDSKEVTTETRSNGPLSTTDNGKGNTGLDTKSGQSTSEITHGEVGETRTHGTTKGVELSDTTTGASTNDTGSNKRTEAGEIRDTSTNDREQSTRNVKVENKKQKKKIENEDDVYSVYEPSKLNIKGAKPHMSDLVESAAMAAVEPPDITYTPHLPQELIESGALSMAQLENIVYAGQAHSQTLPNGTRKGHFIGDGTGVGKGREIAGIIMDNFAQGRTKAIWFTMNQNLVADAYRDWTELGNDKALMYDHSKIKAGEKINIQKGVLVSTYGMLKSGAKNNPKATRINQLVEWLGKDFDGVIVFDEAHNMANAIDTQGTRGKSKASQTALAGIEIQNLLPNARIEYVSATGATDVFNLAYLTRLGLWGQGTAFNNVNDFIEQVGEGGLAAMELVARDMKAMGAYLARSISFKGVEYDTLEHKINPMQKEIYDTMSEAWSIVLDNVEEALKFTNGERNAQAVKNAKGQFYGSIQKFYNQIITAMSMPSVIDDIKKEIKNGNACVIQVVNTNEAAAERQFEKMAETGEDIEELDMTPRDTLVQYLKNCFPIHEFEEYVDDNGNIRTRPVQDAAGNPVISKKAVKKRDELISMVEEMKVPDGPLEMLMDEFGPEMVAEVTGRKRRVVTTTDKNGNKVRQIEKRSKNSGLADAQAFQDGKKLILIFSNAGGTGKSYHADRRAKNQRKRIHYLLQPGWNVFGATQGLGRTHRTNQVMPPTFRLVTTDIMGQKRFTSTIARRLDQLGALTKGQRDTGSGMFGEKDNLESTIAKDALSVFYKELYNLKGREIFKKLGIDKQMFDRDTGAFKPDKAIERDTGKFLNRILALKVDLQNEVFDHYMRVFDKVFDKAVEDGTVDMGLENVVADKIEVAQEETIRDQDGIKTNYVQMNVYTKPKLVEYKRLPKLYKNFKGVYFDTRTDEVKALYSMGTRTNDKGEVVEYYIAQSPMMGKKSTYVQKTVEENLSPLPEENWKQLWTEETAKQPEFLEEKLHMLTGTLLPIWNMLPKGNASVKRVMTDSGETYLGRVIAPKEIDEILRRFDMKAKKETYTNEQIRDLVISKNKVIRLDSREKLRFARKRVSGEWRIEVLGNNIYYLARNYPGIIKEKIEYKDRYFIPLNDNGLKIIENMIKSYPIMEIKDNVEKANDEVHGMTSMRGQSHTKVHEPTGKNTDVKGTKSASQIFKAFEKQFGAAIKRRPKRGTLGTYNSREHLIRVKKANDIAVLCHETGHLLDRTYKWSEDSKAPYAKELMRLGETSSKKSYSDEKRRREGVAEFLRYYFTEPETAQASSFYNYFVESMEKGELDAVDKLQKDVWKLLNLSAVERVKKSIKPIDRSIGIVRGTKKVVNAAKTFSLDDTVRLVKTQLWDENYNLYWAAEEMGGPLAREVVENKVAQYRGFEGKALFSINEDGGYQIDLKGEKVGRSYKDITKPIHKNEKVRSDFMTYQVARRAEDYYKRKLEMPDDIESYRMAIQDLEDRYPEFSAIFDELLQYRHNNLKQLLDSGIINEESYNKILEENPNYVPLKRDFDNYKDMTGTSKKMAAAKNMIKKVKGSGRDIIDPEVNDITSTFIYRSAAERNQILLKLADLSQVAKDAGHIMSKANVPMQTIELEMKQLEKIIRAAIEKNDLPTVENLDLDIMNKIFKPNYAAKENQVVVYRNGKAELYDIHPDLYKTLASFNVNQANMLVEIMATVGKISKVGTIFTPTYIYRNISRDTQQNLIASEAGINPLDIVKGVYSALRQDDYAKDFKKQGGGTNYFTSTDENFIRKAIKDMEMEHKSIPRKVLHKSVHLLTLMQDIIEPFENGGRIAEYRKTLDNAKKEKVMEYKDHLKKQGISGADVKRQLKAFKDLQKSLGHSEETIAKAIARSRDISVDYKRMGALVRLLQLNRTHNYSNPNIQGTAKDIRLLTNKRTRMRTIMRTLAYITMPTVALWLINKENENYKELPHWQRDLFFNIPKPVDGDFTKATLFIPIPRVSSLGILFGGVVERILDATFEEDPRAFDGLYENMAQVWGMSPVPSAILPYYEAKTNENFLGQPIINLGDQRLPGYLQFNNYTSETAKGIAKLTKNLPLEEDSPFKSAKKIDHMIRGGSGTWGTVGLAAVDKALGKDRLVLEPLAKGFVVDSQRRPETINRFYDYKQSLDLAYAETMLTKEKSKYFDPAMREVFTNINSKLGDLAKVRQALEGTSNGPEKEKQLLELDAIELKLMKAATGMFEEKYRK